MKPAATTLMLVLLVAITANSQLSFLPQMGFEQAKNSVSVNELSSFSPMGFANNFRANLRADYRFKKGHSPYISLGTAPGAMAFSFSDAETAARNFSTASNALQFRIEAGYQYSSKPITLKKASKTETSKVTVQRTEIRNRCGSYYSYNRQHRTATSSTKKSDNNLTLRLQPSIGVAYLPSVKNTLIASGGGYQYNAGNYTTSMVSGMGFEFGRGKQRLFTLTVFHTKGLGQLEQQNITKVENEKISSITSLNSRSTGWGMMVGVPISFAKNKKLIAPAKTTAPTQHKQYYKSKCGYYRSSGSGIRRI